MDAEDRVADIVARIAELPLEERMEVLALLPGRLDALMREAQRQDESE